MCIVAIRPSRRTSPERAYLSVDITSNLMHCGVAGCMRPAVDFKQAWGRAYFREWRSPPLALVAHKQSDACKDLAHMSSIIAYHGHVLRCTTQGHLHCSEQGFSGAYTHQNRRDLLQIYVAHHATCHENQQQPCTPSCLSCSHPWSNHALPLSASNSFWAPLSTSHAKPP